MQVQNLAFARKKVVFDVEPVHRFEMPAQNCGRNQLGNRGDLASGVFDGVQRLQPHLLVLLVGFVPLRNPGIEIPTVVVEARLPAESLDFCAGLFFDVRKSNHHIGNLHAGVVDVVLNIDFPARIAQQPDERVPENGIAQMPDVRSFVRIDARVLDQNLAGECVGRWIVIRAQGGSHPGAVDLDIQIPGRRDLQLGNTFDWVRSPTEWLRRSSMAPSVAAWQRETEGSRSLRVPPSEAAQ